MPDLTVSSTVDTFMQSADAAAARTAIGAAPSTHVGAGGTAHAEAVAAGAAGFMSGADKAKLDGIEAGANKGGGTVVEAVWNQVSPALVYAVPAGQVATSVTVEVTETWDGVGAAISLGDGVTPDLYLQAGETELTALASFDKTIHTIAAASVYLTITPGSGASQGRVRLRITSLPQGI